MERTDFKAIADFPTKLAERPDADRVRALLAQAFDEHRADIWPFTSGVGITREWIEANVDEVLAVVVWLHDTAPDLPGGTMFLNRLVWLPPLLHRLDQPVPLDA
jgi:hypothetical protein